MNNSNKEKQGFIRPGMAVGLLIVLFFFAGSVISALNGGLEGKEGKLEFFGVVLAAGLTLAIYSFLYKDNPLFKLAEHIYLGVSVGYATTVTVHQYLAKQVYVPLVEPLLYSEQTELAPKWSLLIPIVLGIFMLAQVDIRCKMEMVRCHIPMVRKKMFGLIHAN